MMGKSHLVMNGCVLVQSICLTELVIHLDADFLVPIKKYIETTTESFFSNLSLTSIGLFCLAIFLYFLGALVPDMDSEKSMLGRYFHIPVEHHGITHSVWVLFALFLFSFLFRPMFGLFLGCFVHDFVDALGAQGVCWFYPLTKYRKYPGGAKVKQHHVVKLYHSSCPSEYVVVTIVCMLTIAWAVWRIYALYFN